MGDCPKWVKSKKRRKRKKERRRANNDKNNGQLRIAPPPRVAHAKPSGPTKKDNRKKKRNNKNNGQLCIATSGGARKAVWANKQTIGDRILKVVSHIFCVIYPNATHRGWLRYSGDIHYVFKSYTL